jgi:hypothetical protein
MYTFARMPFGRHRGRPLSAIPTDYLHWLKTIDTEPWLRNAVEAELLRRYGRTAAGGPASPPALPWDKIVSTWFGRLALRFHPDRGGHPERMVALNLAREELVKVIEEERELCPAR